METIRDFPDRICPTCECLISCIGVNFLKQSVPDQVWSVPESFLQPVIALDHIPLTSSETI